MAFPATNADVHLSIVHTTAHQRRQAQAFSRLAILFCYFVLFTVLLFILLPIKLSTCDVEGEFWI